MQPETCHNQNKTLVQNPSEQVDGKNEASLANVANLEKVYTHSGSAL